MYAIRIFKEQIPYKTRIEIGGQLVFLRFKYNLYDNRVYVDLLDIDENILIEDEPIILGIPLFLRCYIDESKNIRIGFPKAVIIPNFIDSRNTNKITFDNIENIRLYVEEL